LSDLNMESSGVPSSLVSIVGNKVSSASYQNRLNVLSKYFGEPARSSYDSIYDRRPYTTFDLPEVYKGRNLFIKDTLDTEILERRDNFPTTLIPWFPTDEIKIQLNEWNFDTVLIDEVPHKSLSRLIPSHKTQFSARSKRRGIAFVLELDFFNSADGDIAYYRNIIGIANSVQETQNYDTIFSLLTCKNYERQIRDWADEAITFEQLVMNEVADYASVCYNEDDIHILVLNHKRTMLSTKDLVMIVSPGSKIYLTQVAPHKTTFMSMGPDGVTRTLEGPEYNAIMGDIPVFEVNDFNLSTEQSKLQPLSKRSVIGEYNTMTFAEYKGDDLTDKYRNSWRDIYMYDEENDTFGKVSFIKALAYSRIFDMHGGNYSEDLIKLLKQQQNSLASGKSRRGKKKMRRGPVDDSSDDDDGADEDEDLYAHRKECDFFLFTEDCNNEVMLPSYFGQMPQRAVRDRDFIQVAQTLMSHLPGDKSQARSELSAMIDFVKMAEEEPYNREFFARCSQVNAPFSIDADGKWAGEHTPGDLMKHWGIDTPISEWRGNAYGSLNLPNHRPSGVRVPPGFINPPGLLTIASCATDPTSVWQELGKEVAGYCSLVARIISVVRTYLPSCEFIDSINRAPWYHHPNSFTVFWNSVINVERDPIFLGINLNSLSTRGGSAPKEPVSGVADGTDMDNNNVVRDCTVSVASIRDLIKTTVDPDSTGFKFNGKDYPYTAMLYSVTVPSGLRAEWNMNEVSGAALESLNTVLTNESDRAKLYDIINTLASGGKIWGTSKKVRSTRAQAQRLVVLLDKRNAEAVSLINALWQMVFADSPATSPSVTDIVNLSLKSMKEVDDKPPYYDDATAEKLVPGLLSKADDPPSAGQLQFSKDLLELQQALEDYRRVSGDTAEFKFKADWATSGRRTGGDLDGYLTTIADRTAKINAYEKRVKGDKDSYVSALKAMFAASNKKGTTPSSPSSGKSLPPLMPEYEDATLSFFRCPLTMTRQLLVTSLSHEFPVIRAGDPTRNFLEYYSKDKTGISTVPIHMTNRPQYSPIDAAAAFYNANVGNRESVRTLEHTGFMARLISRSTPSNIGPRFSDSGSGKKKKGKGHHHHDDSSSSDDDPLAEYGGGSASMRKRKEGIEKKASAIVSHTNNLAVLHTDEFKERFKFALKQDDPLLRYFLLAVFATRCDNYNQWATMHNGHIHLPIGVILWRLGITHMMDTWILFVKGLQTGGNLYGNSNFILGSDTQIKIIQGNFTFYSRAIIWKERNVRLLENVKPAEYAGGSNLRFIKRVEDIVREDRNRPSIIPTAVPIAREKYPTVMNITGFNPIPKSDLFISDQQHPCYDSYQFYSAVYNLKRTHGHKLNLAAKYHERDGGINSVALRGHQFNFNPSSGLFDLVTECKGHRKRNGVGSGCAEVWNGRAKAFVNQDWRTYNLK
jgi:hypothetical protein